MAKYLRTSGISAGLEDLIRDARERLYIISPYLKLSDKIKELLNDKEREKVEVRIIFGKQELNPAEMSFLEKLKYVRLYFSKNLHAKCYLNESKMIITSMNLYEFSQQNNREMGIIVERSLEGDKQVYEDAWKDIESILNNADDFAYAKVNKNDEAKNKQKEQPREEKKQTEPKSNHFAGEEKHISTSALAKELGISSKELFAEFERLGWIEKRNDEWILTKEGKKKEAVVKKGQYGDYIAWSESILKDLHL